MSAWQLAVLVVIVVGAALRIWAGLSIGNVADVEAYRDQVEIAVVRHENIYEHAARNYPYLPGWLATEAVTWHASQALNIEFWQAIRLVIIAGDIAVCFVVWWLASRWQGPVRGRLAAAVYALAPIALLASGNHGQFDSLPMLFSLLAAAAVLSERPRRAYESGALLAVAILLKPFPLILLPAFLVAGHFDWRGRAQLLGTMGLLVLAGTAPFLIQGPGGVFRSVVDYHGVADVGLGGLLRALWLDRTGFFDLPGLLQDDIAELSRLCSLALIGLVVLVLRRDSLPRLAAGTYLAFLSVYGGLSAQYLVWPLAWLLISDLDLRWSALYAVWAAVGAAGMYLVFWPGVLIPGSEGLRPENAARYALAETSLLVVTWSVFAAVVWPRLRDALRNDWPVRVAAIVFVLSMLPVLDRIWWLAGEYRDYEGQRAAQVRDFNDRSKVQELQALVDP